MAKATKKTSTKSTKRMSVKRVKREVEDFVPTEQFETPFNDSDVHTYQSSDNNSMNNNASTSPYSVKNLLKYAVVAVIAGAFVYMLTNPGLPMVALVNGQPIFRWDLNTVLQSRYGQQTLEGLITEKLIASEAQKSNVNITSADIDKRATEILASFGSSMSVDEFLRLQGIKREEFNNQLKLQLQVQKLLTNDLKISDGDITNFIATNAAVFTATDPAKLREEAVSAITDEHVSKKFNTWLEELRARATVQQFL